MPKVHISVKITEEDKRAIRVKAAEMDISMSEFIRRAVNYYLRGFFYFAEKALTAEEIARIVEEMEGL